MRILITNVQLTSRTGTEVVVRDLEAALRWRGHEVCVYTPHRGAMAVEIEQAGGRVVTEIDDVPFVPDVIHGHHHVPTVTAAVRFPSAPVVFVCHDRLAPSDIPPLLPSVHRYVAVDRNCLERLEVDAGIDPGRIRLIHNAVDLHRSASPRVRAATPSRAALLSNYARRGGFAEVVERACAEVGLELTVAGAGVGRSVDRPEDLLAEHDLVFAKARSALEAMASGCAVVVIDEAGLGAMVTRADVAEAADWNFGARCMQRTPSVSAVVDEIRRYDAADAREVSEWIRAHRSLDAAVLVWEELYREAIDAIDASEAVSGRHPPVSWASALGSLLGHAGRMESVVRATQRHGSFIQPRLAPAAVANIGMGVVLCPRRVAPGEEVELIVEVRNGSSEPIASTGAEPVHLSSHWSDPVSGEWREWDGPRTALVAPVQAGATWTQPMRVRAPDEVGMARLHLTLVQETVVWFDTVAPARFPSLLVEVAVDDGAPGASGAPGTVRLSAIAEWAPDGFDVRRDAVVHHLGFVSSGLPGLLVFAERPAFLDRAVAHGVAAVVVPPSLADRVPATMGMIVAEHPRRTFAAIHRLLAGATDFYGRPHPSDVHPSATVHTSAVIDPVDVRIGAGCVIGPHVTIGRGVTLEEGVVVDGGATLGASGFQTAHDDVDDDELPHAGRLRIGARSRVFAGAVVARAVFREETSIGARCRIGNLAFVSHSCVVGAGVHVGHGAVLNGHVHVGPGTWIGPGATIANDVRIGGGAVVSLGATVIRDVEPGARVTGSIAVEHWSMMRATAALEQRRRRPERS